MSTEPAASAAAPAVIDRLQEAVPEALAMLAGMRLEVFSQLADGPRIASDLASSLGVSAERLSRLLYGLVAGGLLTVDGGRFANTPEAAAFLVKGRSGYLGDLHELLDQLWHADLRTAQSIQSGRAAALHDFSAMADDELATMLRGMHAGAAGAGRDLAQRLDFSACRSVIDIGGGSGGFVAALCDAHPHLSGYLFELPRTAHLGADILAQTPGGHRVTIEVGDILAAPPRTMHDAVMMRAVIQVLGPEDAACAVRHAAAALHPGGTLYIAGAGILTDDRLSPKRAVFFNITFMNLYASGASYTLAEHAAWLSAAGCGGMERILLPDGGSILRATKLR